MEELHELCRLRSTLEAFAAVRLKRSAQREAVVESLLKHLELLHQYARDSEYGRFHREDMKLHRTLILSAEMPTLLTCWEKVTQNLNVWIQHVKKVYWPSLMTLYREHEYLLEAWMSDEDWVAEQATHHHLEAGWFRVASAQGEEIVEIHPVDRATSFICTHFASQIDVEWLAQNVCFVSASHLTRLFRERLGISPHAFLKRIRMEKSAELLKHQSDPVHLVAQKVGYKNVSHFVRDFRVSQGSTPKQYRGKNLTR